MSDSIRDRVMNYVKNAPEAFTGYGPSPQFGKATMTAYVVSWQNKQRMETPLSEWQGDIGNNVMEIWFEVDLQEFNPNLTFNYLRKVRVEVNKKGKDGSVEKKTDWSEIVLPSLLEVLGEDWTDKLDKGIYVEVVDEVSNDKPWHKKVNGVEQFNDDGSPTMVTPNTIKFLRAFKSKEECLAAHQERYSSKGDSSAATNNIPADIATKAKQLRGAFGDDKFKSDYATQEPFNSYNVDDLMAASA